MLGTSTLDVTLSTVRRCLEAAGLSVLVAALEEPQAHQARTATPLLVFTTAGDAEAARDAITASGLSHLLSREDPPTAAASGPAALELSAAPPNNVPRLAPVRLPSLQAPRRAGAESRSAGKLGPELSTREIEVLQLFANGALHDQAARELHVSPKTVKNHLSHIYAKLGVANRTQAVAFAVRQGIVSIA